MKRGVFVVLVGILLVGGWVLVRGDPDVRAICKAFDRLVELAQWEQREDVLRAGLAARGILEHCVKDLVFKVNGIPYALNNRGELQAAILHARTTADRLTIQVTDSELEIAPDRQSAEMYVTARVAARYAGDRSSELRSVKLRWQKTEDGWRLARVESYDTIDAS